MNAMSFICTCKASVLFIYKSHSVTLKNFYFLFAKAKRLRSRVFKLLTYSTVVSIDSYLPTTFEL